MTKAQKKTEPKGKDVSLSDAAGTRLRKLIENGASAQYGMAIIKAIYPNEHPIALKRTAEAWEDIYAKEPFTHVVSWTGNIYGVVNEKAFRSIYIANKFCNDMEKKGALDVKLLTLLIDEPKKKAGK